LYSDIRYPVTQYIPNNAELRAHHHPFASSDRLSKVVLRELYKLLSLFPQIIRNDNDQNWSDKEKEHGGMWLHV